LIGCPIGKDLKFAFASYSAWYGHIRDAQYLALDLGLNLLQWDGHVRRYPSEAVTKEILL
jgi:prepilin-type processing-associated H-X9-DG protein